MTSDSVLKVSRALWDGIPVDLRDARSEYARRVIVLAAYLDMLSESFGMSEEHERELEKRSELPAPFLAFIRHCVGDQSGSLEPDALRNAIYDAVADAVAAADDETLFTIAQVYWALSHDGSTRPLLKLRGGEPRNDYDRNLRPIVVRSHIWLAGKDLATLERVRRSEATVGMGLTSGQRLRTRGAGLAVIAARHLLHLRSDPAPSLEEATFHRDADGRISSIRWGAPNPRAREPATNTSAEEELDRLARRADASGAFETTAILLDALVKLIQRTADTSPEQEAALAVASLRAALASIAVGELPRAIELLSTTQTISQTLSSLRPDETQHKLHNTFALVMLGALHMQDGRPQEAESSLLRGVAIAQHLTDQNSENEDALAIALTMLGSVQLVVGHGDDAERHIARAATISRKLAERDPANNTARLLHALSLYLRGVQHVDSDQYSAARVTLESAISLCDGFTGRILEDVLIRILMALSLQALGGLEVIEDRELDGEPLVRRAVEILGTSIETDRIPPSLVEASARALGSGLFMLGLICLLTERVPEGEATLLRSIAVLEQHRDEPGVLELLSAAADTLAAARDEPD